MILSHLGKLYRNCVNKRSLWSIIFKVNHLSNIREDEFISLIYVYRNQIINIKNIVNLLNFLEKIFRLKPIE